MFSFLCFSVHHHRVNHNLPPQRRMTPILHFVDLAEKENLYPMGKYKIACDLYKSNTGHLYSNIEIVKKHELKFCTFNTTNSLPIFELYLQISDGRYKYGWEDR